MYSVFKDLNSFDLTVVSHHSLDYPELLSSDHHYLEVFKGTRKQCYEHKEELEGEVLAY
jgi:hypothetical protein